MICHQPGALEPALSASAILMARMFPTMLGLAATANALCIASTPRIATPRAHVRMTEDSSTCYFAVVHEFNDNAEVNSLPCAPCNHPSN